MSTRRTYPLSRGEGRRPYKVPLALHHHHHIFYRAGIFIPTAPSTASKNRELTARLCHWCSAKSVQLTSKSSAHPVVEIHPSSSAWQKWRCLPSMTYLSRSSRKSESDWQSWNVDLTQDSDRLLILPRPALTEEMWINLWWLRGDVFSFFWDCTTSCNLLSFIQDF